MDLAFSQDNRIGKLTTELGKDVLVLLRFSGTEYMNGLFDFTVDALATRHTIDLNALLGTHATVELLTDHHGPRLFDGIVTNAAWAGISENGHKYTLTLRPWLWLAGFRRNQRIFHNKTPPQILEELFKTYAEMGAPALKNRLTRDYPKLEYTVQYGESDLDFAKRLMERFGIAYHFTFDAASHTMVLTDILEEHDAIAGGARPYIGTVGQRMADSEHFWEWITERSMTTGVVRLMDYNFKTPTAAMEVDQTGGANYRHGTIESFDYPGNYDNQTIGKQLARLRTAQERGADRRSRAVGRVLSLGAGMRMKLTGQQVEGVKDEGYLCLSATHEYRSDAYGTGAAAGADEPAYSGSYTLMPGDASVAPARKTDVPRIPGPLTAVVVGAGEIDCDEFGRILVRFHWDLAAAHSMRCRVSQAWAGQGWGGMVIPRVGMEVIVEFIGGDPDMPLVTGCVFNGRNMPPYKLPDNKTRATLMTKTHQGQGFNELRFEDEKAKEEVFLHAQKDMNEKVENNATRRVNKTVVDSIGNNRGVEVTNNATEVVGGDYKLLVGPDDRGTFTPGDATSNTQGIGEAAVKLDGVAAGRGNMEVTIKVNLTESVGENASQSVGGNKNTTVAKTYSIDVGESLTLNVKDKITIKVGASTMTMDRDGGIAISGRSVDMKASGLVKVKGSTITLN